MTHLGEIYEDLCACPYMGIQSSLDYLGEGRRYASEEDINGGGGFWLENKYREREELVLLCIMPEYLLLFYIRNRVLKIIEFIPVSTKFNICDDIY